MGMSIETMTASKSKRKKEAPEALVNPLGSPTLAERIASLKKSQRKHSKGAPVAGGTRLVLPESMSTSSDSDRENCDKEGPNGASGAQSVVDWPETESWAQWSNALEPINTNHHNPLSSDSKSNAKAPDGPSTGPALDSAKHEATSEQPTTLATLTADSVNRRLDEILTKLSNLSLPGNASMEEKEDIDLIRNMASLSFEKIIGHSSEPNCEQSAGQKKSMTDLVSWGDTTSFPFHGLELPSDFVKPTQNLTSHSTDGIASGFFNQFLGRESGSIASQPSRSIFSAETCIDDTSSQVSTFSPSKRGPVFEIHTTWPVFDSTKETGSVHSLGSLGSQDSASRCDVLSESELIHYHPRKHDDPGYPYYGQVGTGRLGIAERVDVFQPHNGPHHKGFNSSLRSLASPIQTAVGVGGTPRTANGSAANRSFWPEQNIFSKPSEDMNLVDSLRHVDEANQSQLPFTPSDVKEGPGQSLPPGEQNMLLQSLPLDNLHVSSPSFFPQGRYDTTLGPSSAKQSPSFPLDVQAFLPNGEIDKHTSIRGQTLIKTRAATDSVLEQSAKVTESLSRPQVTRELEFQPTAMEQTCDVAVGGLYTARDGRDATTVHSESAQRKKILGSNLREREEALPHGFAIPDGSIENQSKMCLYPADRMARALDQYSPPWNTIGSSNGWLHEADHRPRRFNDLLRDASDRRRDHVVKLDSRLQSPTNTLYGEKADLSGLNTASYPGTTFIANDDDLIPLVANRHSLESSPSLPKPEEIFARLGLSDQRLIVLQDKGRTAAFEPSFERLRNENVGFRFATDQGEWEVNNIRKIDRGEEFSGDLTASAPASRTRNAYCPPITALLPRGLDGESFQSPKTLTRLHHPLRSGTPQEDYYAQETAEIDKLLALLSPKVRNRREVMSSENSQCCLTESESRGSSFMVGAGAEKFEELSRNESQSMSRLSSPAEPFQLSTVWMNRVTPRAHRIDPPNDVDPAIFIVKRLPTTKSRTLRDPPNESSRTNYRKTKKEPEGWGIESRSHRITTMVCSSCSSSTGVVGDMVDDEVEMKMPERLSANEDDSDLFENLDEDETLGVAQNDGDKGREPVDEIVGPPDKLVGLPLEATPTVTRRFRTSTPLNLPPRSMRDRTAPTNKPALPSDVGTGVGTLTSSLFAVHDGKRSTHPSRVRIATASVPAEIATCDAKVPGNSYGRFSEASNQQKDATKATSGHVDEKEKPDPLLNYWHSIGTMKTLGSFDSVSPVNDQKAVARVNSSPLYMAAPARQRKAEHPVSSHQNGIPKVVSGQPSRATSEVQNQLAKDRRLYVMGPLLSGDSDDFDSLTEDSEKDSVPPNTTNKNGCSLFMCSDGEWLKGLPTFRF